MDNLTLTPMELFRERRAAMRHAIRVLRRDTSDPPISREDADTLEAWLQALEFGTQLVPPGPLVEPALQEYERLCEDGPVDAYRERVAIARLITEVRRLRALQGPKRNTHAKRQSA